ncbi:unnamed protein product [Brachionus calyciflorus]|uniref:Heparan-sulfate 6-O-sulfotransferase n=1 Tax=Brachionus calyciflorus TaxID=104777 RepID=A0A813M9V5_9BILA|nr:unnamed protein product [Brachionus calyciflorus]
MIFDFNAISFTKSLLSKILIDNSKRLNFDLNKNVLVFLHIQKTGGSDFDRFLTKNLALNDEKKACRFVAETEIAQMNFNKKIKKFKKYRCDRLVENDQDENQSWYFSRQTFGWACGLHASLSQLKLCMSRFYPELDPLEDFFFFTIIRHPVKRYISEWKHVSRGATWIRKNDGTNCITENYKNCFRGSENWGNVTLEDFMSCEFNLANNRQTRMLSNFGYDCDRKMDESMLEDAKKNLEAMSFFALNEFQYLSQKLFEKMFDTFKFTRDLTQSNSTIADVFLNESRTINEQKHNLLKRIEELNSMDMDLYKFAINLFFERLNYYEII